MSDDDRCDVAYESGRILVGSCIDRLADLADASVDSIVTDPPYELGFMGKRWDASGVAYNVELWRQCLRVLKPGGHLLAFGGTRTYHRMTVAIEDAGFEVRDSIHWMYGSGFPKSLDVSKAIDRQRYDRADVYRVTGWVRAARDAAGLTNKEIDAAFGFAGMSGHWTSSKSQPSVPTLEQVPTLLAVLGMKAEDVPDEIRRLLWDLNSPKGQPGANWWKREVTGQHEHAPAGQTWQANNGLRADLTAKERRDVPATNAARTWEGWGTALKPAHEPIVVARKPLNGTVAANVLEHGTGALNIERVRVGDGGQLKWNEPRDMGYGGGTASASASPVGRWPANIVFTHDASCQQVGSIKDTFSVVDGFRDYPQNSNFGTRAQVTQKAQSVIVPVWSCVDGCPVGELDGQQDGASRFFTVTDWDVPAFLYVAKASTQERNAGLDGLPTQLAGSSEGGNDKRKGDKPQLIERQNFHPTVKPVALMRHLVRLVTPPSGTILDPFLGSGTTAVAAVLEGFQWVGCEITADYLPIIEARVRHAETERHNQPPTLFDWSEYE